MGAHANARPRGAPPETLVAALDAAVRRGAPGALELPGERASLAQLAERTHAVGRRLLGAGVARGETVGILLQPSVDYYAAVLGAMRIGAIATPVNPRYKADELGFVLRHARMRVLLVDAAAAAAVDALDVPPSCRLVRGVDDEDFVAAGATVSADDVQARHDATRGDDDAFMLYTSGTTARPKGCVHRHAALLAVTRGFVDRLRITPRDRLWTPLPLHHIGGLISLSMAVTGGCVVVHTGHFRPDVAVDQLGEGCTVAFPGFETIWFAVLDHPRFAALDLTTLRLTFNVGTAGSLRAMQARLPDIPQVSCYGGTESCGMASLGAPDDALDSRIDTGGRPLPGMEVRVVRPGTGADCPVGQVGELLVRGPQRLVRYHDDPEATAQAIDEDGWFHSGDLGLVDADGCVAFVDRLKDMLKVGGENVAAAELESYLLTHPAIKIAQVVAAPDRRYGQVPAAFLELRAGATATAQEVQDHCVGRIATYKVPRYVRFVTEWPMSGTKVRKLELRERIAAELDQRGIVEAPKIEVEA